MLESERQLIIPVETLYTDGMKNHVIRYGDKVVKSSPRLDSSEVKTMRFVAANTSIPVPRVYEECMGPVRSYTMEYIEGDPLDKVWKDLPEEQKLAIVKQVRGFICEMRTLKGSYIGAIDHGKADDSRMQSIKGGPFDDEHGFNEFLLSDLLKACPKFLAEIAMRSLRTDHEIVFTHGDISPRNIMVKNGEVVALLDWEFAGYYPEYWEYIKSFRAPDYRITWHNYIDHMFPQAYESEYIYDFFLSKIVRH